MINTWEAIHGKATKKIPKSHSVQFLKLSNGGQGPTVGLTRMSRGRQKETIFSPAQTETGFRKSRHRSPSPPGSPTAKKHKKPEFYLQECEVPHKKKQSLFQIVGNEIGVERIAKVCLKVSEEDPLLQPLKKEINMPLAKTLMAYLLGQNLPEFASNLPEFKRELIRARDHYKLTGEHFDKMQAMFQKAVHGLCHNNATRLEWDTVSACFRREIEHGDLHAVTDKRICAFEIVLRGLKFVPHDGDAKKIIVDIIMIAKQLPDPDIKRAVMRSFYPEALTLTECAVKGNGLLIRFQLLPELYDDRITLKQTDFGHTKQFLDQLHRQFDPDADLEAAAEMVDVSEEEQDPRILAAKQEWQDKAAAITQPMDSLIPVEEPDYDGMQLETQLAETLHPGPSILELYPSLPSFEGDQKIVFEEQNRRIQLLEQQLHKLSQVHAKELTRTRKMLMLAQDRIGELEEMTTLLPTEAAQAQNLVFRITQDSIRRSLRQGDDDLDSEAASLQMLESCPTPSLLPTTSAAGFHQAAARTDSGSANTTQSRLMPGESIDTKLKEWIEVSNRFADAQKSPRAFDRPSSGGKSPGRSPKSGSKRMLG
ncbi:unnamed protein product [Amoebophrya sp. A120]|nr:unnamed protein product [Amoebophrya sp. A120]|eukprot:GSA120T00002730001.1